MAKGQVPQRARGNEHPSPLEASSSSTSREHGPEAPGSREPSDTSRAPPGRKSQMSRTTTTSMHPHPVGGNIRWRALTPTLTDHVSHGPRLSKPQTQAQFHTHGPHTHKHTYSLFTHSHTHPYKGIQRDTHPHQLLLQNVE